MAELEIDFSPFSPQAFSKPVLDVEADYDIASDYNVEIQVKHPPRLDVEIRNTHASNPFAVSIYGAFGLDVPGGGEWEQWAPNKNTANVAKGAIVHYDTDIPFDWIQIRFDHTASKDSSAHVFVRLS